MNLAPMRYDLALLERGLGDEFVRQRALELVAFARRPSIHPMGEVTGGRELGFNGEIIAAMAERWKITQEDIDQLNDSLGWVE